MNDTYINDFYKIIGKNVKRIRKEKGVSQLDFDLATLNRTQKITMLKLVKAENKNEKK